MTKPAGGKAAMSAGDETLSPMTICPKCGHREADFDGLGVAYCDTCGYCDHRTVDLIAGQWICGGCGHELNDNLEAQPPDIPTEDHPR